MLHHTGAVMVIDATIGNHTNPRWAKILDGIGKNNPRNCIASWPRYKL